MKTAIYLRVSNKDGRQDEANQEPDCRRLCEARGWEPTIFRERESGAKARPVWSQLVDAVRRGEYRAVVFWALDRTGRTRVQVAHDLGQLFRFGAEVASVKDAWLDMPAGPLRDLLIQLMAWFAEGERTRLIERTKAGMARARAEGRLPGRRPVASEKRAAMFAAWKRGGSVVDVAYTLGLPHSTVRTYFGRFEAVAKKGAEEQGAETAENQGGQLGGK